MLLHCKQNVRKKALFIIVDGIPPDAIEKVNMPHLDEMAEAGGYTRAYMSGEKGGYSQIPMVQQ